MEFVDLSQKKSLHTIKGNEGMYIAYSKLILRRLTQHQK